MKREIEMVKIEWSQLATGVAMLVFPPFCAFVWLSNKIGLGKAFAVSGIIVIVALWLIAGAVLTIRGLKKG